MSSAVRSGPKPRDCRRYAVTRRCAAPLNGRGMKLTSALRSAFTKQHILHGQISMRKTVIFEKPYHISGNIESSYYNDLEYMFPIRVVQTDLIGKPREKSETTHHKIKVKITEELQTNWHLKKAEIVKVLFERVKEHIDEKIRKNTLLEKEELKLLTSNEDDECPFNIAAIQDPTDGIQYEIDAEEENDSVTIRNAAYKESYYVDLARIQELKHIQSTQFDLCRLIQLCEELNKSYGNENYLATAILVRSIIDHVPPIFGVSYFSQVANNYSAGTKSFREHMQNLENLFRKISDSFLHTHIRAKEVLPNRNQVNFSPSLDCLLSEIIRILK